MSEGKNGDNRSLVFDHRDQFSDKPGTHALVCGISAYPHLPGGNAEPCRFDLGLTQLTSAALTAYAVHRWLIEHAADLVPPLSTCRLLLAPTPGEVPADIDEGLTPEQLPTLNNFLRSASSWREDAATHPDGMSILYIVGHGLAMSKINQNMLLHDYGDGLGSTLRNSVNTISISQGMDPSSLFPDMALKQLYFFDGCQVVLQLQDEVAVARASDVFDVSLSTTEARVTQIIFFASSPGPADFSKIGGLTLFGEVLLESLEGRAAEMSEGGWSVNTEGLIKWLPHEVRRRGEKIGIEQYVDVGGVIRPAVIARLDTPPLVDVSIDIEPIDYRATTNISVLNWDRELVLKQEAPLSGKLPAGNYMVEVTRPGHPAVRQLAIFYPPRHKIYVNLK